MKKADNLELILCSAGLSFVVSSIIVFAFQLSGIPAVIFLSSLSSVVTPISYKIAKKCKTKQNEYWKKNKILLHQIQKQLQESGRENISITADTYLFDKEIKTALDLNEIKIKQDELNHINQFIFLINRNYYSKIKEKLSSLKREDLVDKVLTQVCFHLKKQNKNNFSEKDVPAVLNNCYFIEEAIKKEITQEFKEAKFNYGSWTDYIIKPKPLPKEEQEQPKKTKKANPFDIDNLNDYQTIITGLSDQPSIKEIGGNNLLNWDIEFLKEVITTMAIGHKKEIREEQPEHDNLTLTASFIYNVMYYSIINQRTEVSQKEILATFKEWEYLSFSLKKEIVDDIFLSQEIKKEEYPYLQIPQKKKINKIVPFRNIHHELQNK